MLYFILTSFKSIGYYILYFLYLKQTFYPSDRQKDLLIFIGTYIKYVDNLPFSVTSISKQTRFPLLKYSHKSIDNRIDYTNLPSKTFKISINNIRSHPLFLIYSKL